MKLTDKKLIRLIANKYGISQTKTRNLINIFKDEIINQVKLGFEVQLTGFGKFVPFVRTARLGVDPQDPTHKVQRPEITVVKFRPGNVFKKALKK